MFFTKYMNILLITATMFFTVGCKSSSHPVVLSEEERAALEKELALSLPSDVVLLYDYIGERDAHMKYRNRLIYSKSAIGLSPNNVPAPFWYFPNEEDTTTIVKSFKCFAPRRDFGTPQSASDLSWCTGPFEFRGTLLKTSNGSYLRVERFANRYPTTTTSAPK